MFADVKLYNDDHERETYDGDVIIAYYIVSFGLIADDPGRVHRTHTPVRTHRICMPGLCLFAQLYVRTNELCSVLCASSMSSMSVSVCGAHSDRPACLYRMFAQRVSVYLYCWRLEELELE